MMLYNSNENTLYIGEDECKPCKESIWFKAFAVLENGKIKEIANLSKGSRKYKLPNGVKAIVTTYITNSGRKVFYIYPLWKKINDSGELENHTVCEIMYFRGTWEFKPFIPDEDKKELEKIKEIIIKEFVYDYE